MKKYISFSLWGDSKLYCEGAIENIRAAKEVYPGWICKFFVASDCPALAILKTLDCEVVEMPPQKGIDRSNEKWTWQIEHCGMFWRYFILEDLGPDDVAIFRDTDSRVSKREADVVNIWLESGKLAHRIHECKEHWNSWSMGGLFGLRGDSFKGIKENIEVWIEFYKNWNHPFIFVDLEWINNRLAPMIGQDVIGFGYGHENGLVEVDPSQWVGAVIHDEWRGQKFIDWNTQSYCYEIIGAN